MKWTLDSGCVSIGHAVICREDSRVYAKDLYKSMSFVVSKDYRVELVPIPPIYTPIKLTNYLFIKLKSEIISKGPEEYWIKAPYELAICVDDKPIAIVNPFKTKYTLFGSVVEGIICRYHESEVFSTEPKDESYEALIKIVIPATNDIIRYSYVLINSKLVSLYRFGSRVYYDMLELSPNYFRPFSQSLNKPSYPLATKVLVPQGLELISRPENPYSLKP